MITQFFLFENNNDEWHESIELLKNEQYDEFLQQYDPEGTNHLGYSYLHVAIFLSNLKMLEFLIEHVNMKHIEEKSFIPLLFFAAKKYYYRNLTDKNILIVLFENVESLPTFKDSKKLYFIDYIKLRNEKFKNFLCKRFKEKCQKFLMMTRAEDFNI